MQSRMAMVCASGAFCNQDKAVRLCLAFSAAIAVAGSRFSCTHGGSVEVAASSAVDLCAGCSGASSGGLCTGGGNCPDKGASAVDPEAGAAAAGCSGA